jgi:hypothetical protein
MPRFYFFHCSNSDCDFEAYRYRNFSVCPRCESPVIREEPPDFRAACWVCGSNKNLEMFAHRNEKRKMVGWLFACTKCAAHTADRDVIVELAPRFPSPAQ